MILQLAKNISLQTAKDLGAPDPHNPNRHGVAVGDALGPVDYFTPEWFENAEVLERAQMFREGIPLPPFELQIDEQRSNAAKLRNRVITRAVSELEKQKRMPQEDK